MDDEDTKRYEAAVEHKNRLLEYDQISAERMIISGFNCYFVRFIMVKMQQKSLIRTLNMINGLLRRSVRNTLDLNKN